MWAISLLMGLMSPTDLGSSHVGYLTFDGFDVTNISRVKLCGLSHCWQVLCQAIGCHPVDGFEVTNMSCIKPCGLFHC